MLIKIRRRGQPRFKPLGSCAVRIWGPGRPEYKSIPAVHIKPAVVVKLGRNFKSIAQLAAMDGQPQMAEQAGILDRCTNAPWERSEIE